MALIDLDNISKNDKLRNSIHGKVVTTYTSFTKDGKKVLQFDIYGSPDREHAEKISQSFQIDKDGAVFICKLLQEEFNL